MSYYYHSDCENDSEDEEWCQMCGFLRCACGFDDERKYDEMYDCGYKECFGCVEIINIYDLDDTFMNQWVCECCQKRLETICVKFSTNVNKNLEPVVFNFHNNKYATIDDFESALIGVSNIEFLITCANSLTILPRDVIGVIVEKIIAPTVFEDL